MAKIIYVKHTPTEWGLTLAKYDGGTWGNTKGLFAVPAHIAKNFINGTNANGKKTYDRERVYHEICQQLIDAIRAIDKYKVLDVMKFSELPQMTQDELQKTAMKFAMECITNDTFWETRKAQSTQTPSFRFSKEADNLLLKEDVLGMWAKMALDNSGLRKFRIVGETSLKQVAFTKNQGNTVILKEIDNTTLVDDLGEYQSIDDFNITGKKADRFDFIKIMVDGEMQQWRFEGGNQVDKNNWTRMDVISVDGNQYIVWDGIAIFSNEPSTADLKTWLTAQLAKHADTPWLADKYADLSAFANTAPDYTVVKYNINADGTNNAKGFNYLIKTPNGVQEFRTWEEVKEFINTALKVLENRIKANEDNIATLMSGGLVIPHYTDATERDKHITAPKEGQVCYVGSSGAWVLNTYENGAWVEGHTSQHTTVDTYTKVEIDTKLADKADKSELQHYVRKSLIIKPTITTQAGYIIMDKTEFEAMKVGDIAQIDLVNLNALGSPPADGDRLFAGTTIPITVSPSDYLEFNFKTNPLDTNIADHFALENLEVEKLSATELRYKKWVAKTTEYANKDLSNVDENDLWSKLTIDDTELITLSNDTIIK